MGASRTPLRVLEFYSGVGGMRYALEETRVLATVVEAFEINDVANDVYEFNFGHRPNQVNIQTLTAHKLDSYKADVWMLSPPCQPYTRQGLQKDTNDSRATSFLRLLEMLPDMLRPPTHLFVENVVGFECSVTHDHLIKALKGAGFSIQEFILTPLQFGIPYSRPRYFCLAKREPFSFFYNQLDDRLIYSPAALINTSIELDLETLSNNLHHVPEVSEVNDLCSSIAKYLEEVEPDNDVNMLEEVNEDTNSNRDCYLVPDNLIERWSDVVDVVTRTSKRCCCFTKSYARFVKGTGSVLATKVDSVDSATLLSKDKAILRGLGLRYFTPREVANLHSFPKQFSFPAHVTLKQRYALLGNSLSIAVVASLLKYLLNERLNVSLDC